MRLDKDLDLTTREWTSPGPSNNGFRGTFDGRGHCIELNAPLFDTVGNLAMDVERLLARRRDAEDAEDEG